MHITSEASVVQTLLYSSQNTNNSHRDSAGVEKYKEKCSFLPKAETLIRAEFVVGS